MRIPIAVGKGFYVDESLAISSRECENFRPHIPESETDAQSCLIGTGGVQQMVLTQAGAFNRGGFDLVDVAYFVNGQKLYRIEYTEDAFGNRTYTSLDVSGSESILGTGLVSIASNGEQLSIVAPDYNNQFNMWIYTTAGGLVRVTNPAFDGPAKSVDYSDGYFIYAKANSNKWFTSDLRNGFTFIATDFASAESDPDNIVTIKALRGFVFVFGSRTLEPYQNVGGTGFPYERVNSGIYNKGCAAPFSVVESDNNLFFIGSGRRERPGVWMTNGGTPVKVSTPSIDNLIFGGGIEKINAAWAIQWADKGNFFVQFTIPEVCTVVYELSSGLWFTKSSVDANLNPQPSRITSMVDAYSVLLVGDQISGNIGIYSDEYFYEYDQEIRRYFTTAPIDNNGKPFSIYGVEVVMETGTAPMLGQGSNPIIRLSVSKDGGRTFSPEITRKVGKIGEYRNRISWSPLGRFERNCVLRFDISEPIKCVIKKIEVEIGT